MAEGRAHEWSSDRAGARQSVGVDLADQRSKRGRVVVGGLVVVLLLGALVASLIPVRQANVAAEPAALVDPTRVRQPAVVGRFYPADPQRLTRDIDGYLAAVPAAPLTGLRALVAPHAGYRFSGPVAAVAYRQLQGRAIDTVYVLAPSHHVPFAGVSIPDVDAYRTPLGLCRLAPEASTLRELSPFTSLPEAHTSEHSLEVQLPFLQRVVGEFGLVPLLFGKVDPRAVAEVLAPRLGPGTIVIASSDLSHYHSDATARALDRATTQAIEQLDVAAVAQGEACGKLPVLTVVHLARQLGWKAKVLDLRNSGDTAGNQDRVVGYAAIAFYE
jgi:AmmeMemoRadiSam system protein B